MSVQAAAGYPQYADAAIKYIPTLYAPATVAKYYAKSVLTSITNTDYEGQIKNHGDTVVIRTRPTVTIRPYTKGQDLTDEAPESAPLNLTIDQAKYYSFVIDDVDEKQADIVLSNEFEDDSSEQMRISVDTDVLAGVYAEAHASNQGATAGVQSLAFNLGVTGTPLAVTAANIITLLTQIACVLDEQHAPETGRWVVMPPWMRYLVMNSELKNASITGDGTSIIRNGRIGEVDRMTLYMSSLLATVTDGGAKCWHVIAGQRDAITYAAQLVKNENLRADRKFGWKYRGLHVYGYKVVKPEALVHIYVKMG